MDLEIVIPLDDDNSITILPMLFGKWRLHVGPTGSMFYDDSW